MTRPLLLAAALAALTTPVVAQAEAPRREDYLAIGNDPTIVEGLIAAALTYEIGRVCDSLSVRRVQGLGFLLSLQARARSLGFTQEEVRAYVADKAEKARLEAIARERGLAMGIVEGEPETYCAVGRAEMARGSALGRYLADG